MKNRPTLDARQQYYYSIFLDIARSRPIGMAGALPIPVSEIVAYCELYRIDTVDERDRIYRHVRQLDEVYLKDQAKKAEQKKPAGK